ncbi:MAG TPA: DUF805 domain-containing protein [Allosphingosinicella sp.]|nr:DUF805 domain-containing protein [Allosphingosinicella sp.]
MEWMLMPLKRYAEFSGRSRRKEYWMFVLGVILLYIVCLVLLFAVGGLAGAAIQPGTAPSMTGMLMGLGVFGLIIGIIWLALLIPSLAVTVRRLHDTDRTGWWILAPYGPLILAIGSAGLQSTTLALLLNLLSLAGGIALLVFTLLDGTKGPNRFGEDPKGATNAEVFT